MKRIPLTQGKFALVDNSDYEELNKYKWYAMQKRKLYAVRNITENQIQKHCWMAREIMKCPDDFQVDHINGDTLDNRRCNLRTCTCAENNRNRCSRANTSSKYKGVSWHKQGKKWCTYICVEDCFEETFNKYLGCFANEIEAAKAYDKAAAYYYEEFAHLNFPLVEESLS